MQFLRPFPFAAFANSAPLCILCHNAGATPHLCPGCAADMAQLAMPENVCPRCAGKSVNGAICGKCQKNPPHFDRLWASYRYEAPLNHLIRRWKFTPDAQFSGCLKTLMLARAPLWLPEEPCAAVLPVPLSAARLLARGFNQSRELARAVSGSLNLPLLPAHALQRQHRPPQSSLNRENRLKNLKDSFSLQIGEIPPKILLIDDIVTTGATLDEIARVLKKSGVGSIFAWTLAHGFS